MVAALPLRGAILPQVSSGTTGSLPPAMLIQARVSRPPSLLRLNRAQSYRQKRLPTRPPSPRDSEPRHGDVRGAHSPPRDAHRGGGNGPLSRMQNVRRRANIERAMADKVFVVVASSADSPAQAFVRRYAGQGLRLLTPGDLSYAGWCYRLGGIAVGVCDTCERR